MFNLKINTIMTKINFSEIRFRASLFAESVPIEDFHKQLAEVIYQNNDVASGRLALKLFDNPEIEVNEQELGLIKEALKNFRQWVKVAVFEALGEKAE